MAHSAENGKAGAVGANIPEDNDNLKEGPGCPSVWKRENPEIRIMEMSRR